MNPRFLSLLFVMACLPFAASAANDIAITTGPKTGTYYAFGKDIQRIAKTKKIDIDVRDTEGSVDNIKDINSEKRLTLGIVQSDVLGFLGRSQNEHSKQTVSRLRILFPFYQEEVHVLARDEITSFKELQGKKVAVGEDGSGHMLTAVNLFAIEQIVPSEVRKISPEEGVVAVLKGELDAVVFVGGKPVKIFKNMEDLSKPENQKFALLLHNVHFLPLNSARFYEEYEPTEITASDYSFVTSTVPTIAVQSALVSYDMPPGKNKESKKLVAQRCERLKKFAQMMRSRLPDLKANGHPKWKEVNLSGNVTGWAKDACVWGSKR